MSFTDPSFTIGIEEEYLLVDRAPRDLVAEPPPEMMRECEAHFEGQVSPEFLRSQIEVETGICATRSDTRADLAHLRRTVADVAAKSGIALIAASTLPFTSWHRQVHTDK